MDVKPISLAFTTTTNKEHLTYWQEKLTGELSILNLPHKSTRGSSQSFCGERIRGDIPLELVQSLRLIASKHGATLYQLFLSAYFIILSVFMPQRKKKKCLKP